MKRHQQLIPYPAEKLFWDNGYASIESRCLFLERHETVLARLIRILAAYNSLQTGDVEAGLNVFRELTQSRNASALDAHNTLYLYLYAMAQGGSDSVDRLTILNKALKFFQERTSQIESPELRNIYTRSNRWNRLLIDEARKRRLV